MKNEKRRSLWTTIHSRHETRNEMDPANLFELTAAFLQFDIATPRIKNTKVTLDGHSLMTNFNI